MKRICKRLLLILATLGLGAVAYSLLRAEGERALSGSDETGAGAAGEPPPEPAKPAEAAEKEPRRCTAKTSSGRRCAREALPGSQYCWQHGG